MCTSYCPLLLNLFLYFLNLGQRDPALADTPMHGPGCHTQIPYHDTTNAAQGIR